MAPELRARKPKGSNAPASKSTSKVTATATTSKRKANDEASPVAPKKTKATKESGRSKAAKTTRAAAPSKASKRDEASEDEDEASQVSGEEADEAQALAQVIDSDDENEEVERSEVAYKEGQDVGKVPKTSGQLVKSSKTQDGEPGVVYVGRIPHGFFEHQMRAYFSQFGQINKIRLSRNKITGASKHYAFIEFAEAPVAEIVAKTMDNYLLFGHILKVKMVPKSQVHESLWKGSTNKRFKKVPWNKMAGNRLKKPLTESAWALKIENEEKKRNQRAEKLREIGYEFDGPQLKSAADVKTQPAALEGADDEAPKAIEADPESETKAGKEAEPVAEDLAVKKPGKTAKTAKKSKAKGKKAKA
ncbi:RNA-binding domain-containing protein [Xylariomycetidae sp. FL0641]|nr:RNA-binding domain-containing protein [Xylariomycetidae sp. FL0641]